MILHGLKIEVQDRPKMQAILEHSAKYYTHRERDLFPFFLNRCEVELNIKMSSTKKAILSAAGFLRYDDIMNTRLRKKSYVKDALAKLKERHYKLGLITNGQGIYQAYKIVRLELLDSIDIDKIFISDEIGARKPNKDIFQIVCHLLRISPETCCYVADDLIRDLGPAHESNFLTVHCCNHQRTEGKPGTHNPADIVINDVPELLNTFLVRSRKTVKNKKLANETFDKTSHG